VQACSTGVIRERRTARGAKPLGVVGPMIRAGGRRVRRKIPKSILEGGKKIEKTQATQGYGFSAVTLLRDVHSGWSEEGRRSKGEEFMGAVKNQLKSLSVREQREGGDQPSTYGASGVEGRREKNNRKTESITPCGVE